MNTFPRLGIIAHQTGPIESGTPFGLLTPYYRSLVERASALGWQGCLFSPRDVLRRRRMIWAWVRSELGWERQFVELPHVAYTRLPSVTDEEGEILRWLRAESVQFINQPEVDDMTQDRWRLLAVLQSHPSLTGHIPQTTLLRDLRSVLELLDSGRSVHVTPRYRTAGQGRILLAVSGDDLLLRHERPILATNRTIRSRDALREKVEELLGEAVAQPSIEPLRFEGCPVSIRQLWQRTATGRWQESAAILRLGQPAAQTYQGVTVGLLDRYQASLREVIGTRLKAVRYELRSTSQVTVELLSQRSHGAGELTVDCLITSRGNVQILDVSTLTGLESVQRLTDPTVRLAVLSETLGYAALLLQQSHPTFKLPIIEAVQVH